jgi:hypothetical protein
MSQEAMKQALEALEKHKPKISGGSLAWITHDRAIDALRDVIEQAEKQEPVAWMNKHGACKTSLFREIEAGAKDEYTIPLYTTPPAVEREACARLCDEIAANYNNPTALECAAAIRARG